MVLSRSKSSNSSSLEITADGIKVAQNFDNDIYGSEFEISMSINIGANKIKNYDNYYINGLYNTMNVAKTNYYIKTKGKTAIFAICKGMDSTEESFEGSRKIFEMLEQNKDEILKGKSLKEIERNLKNFTVQCNDMLWKYSSAESKGISVLIVVHTYSGVIFMNSGCCTLLRIKRNQNVKVLSNQTDAMGIKENHMFEIKHLKYLLENNIVLYTANINTVEIKKIFNAMLQENNLKSKTAVFIKKVLEYDKINDCTCMMIHTNECQSIKPATKVTSLICGIITVISVIYILIQCYFGK